jgi:hypothetical protein
MKTLIKIKCYFKSIWMAILGRHWYEKRWLRYDEKFMESIGHEDFKKSL